MGLISRVSSRTYRFHLNIINTMLRVTSARMMPPWGHNARPYFFQGHYFTMMSYSRAKLWPGQFQRFWERKRITERQITQWALPVGLFYSYYRYLRRMVGVAPACPSTCS